MEKFAIAYARADEPFDPNVDTEFWEFQHAEPKYGRCFILTPENSHPLVAVRYCQVRQNAHPETGGLLVNSKTGKEYAVLPKDGAYLVFETPDCLDPDIEFDED